MALNLIQGKQINVNLTGSFSGSFTGNLIGSASFATSSSFSNTSISSSLASTASFAQSGNGAFSGSFSGSGANLSGIPASGIVGLNLSRIATGSVTASVSPTQFSVTSGSSTELVVTGTGVTVGNLITDTHRVTGSLNITGSLTITGSVSATRFTGSLFGTASQAVSASWAPLNAGGLDTQIQFNSGSRLSGSGFFTYNYLSQSLQQGNSVVARGIYSHAEGSQTQAIGVYSHAEGIGSIASSSFSHAEGGDTVARGNYSHAEGGNTLASGEYSHAEGLFTSASGNYSHAEGRDNTASGEASHAEGYATIANGNYSHAEGQETQAAGQASHAEGNLTTAAGMSSHAEGEGASASGNSSHGEGKSTQAIGYASHAEGNNSLTGIKTAFEVVKNAIENGTIVPDSNQDLTPYFTPGQYLYLYDGFLETSVYGWASFLIDTVTWDGSKTTIQLVDTSVTTQAAYIGGINYLINNGTFGSSTGIPGDYAHAEGTSTFAIGPGSHTEGIGAKALGSGSHAEGSLTLAQGNYSHAEGVNTQAIGLGSHTEGTDNKAVGAYAHAEGSSTLALGENSHAEGRSTIASSSFSHAEGRDTVSIGDYSHTEGFTTTANGNYSHAEGSGTTASGEASHAEGESTIASGYGAHAEGFSTTAQGNYSHAEGLSTTAQGDYSHTEGQATQAIGSYSHAEGRETQATAEYSHAEGAYTQATGIYSHAEGNATQATGLQSHAEGDGTIASGPSSHAEGRQTQAFGTGSHAEGFTTYAVGNYSHAEGESVQAKGIGSHAEGTGTIASGSYSHAEGDSTITRGISSHAEGVSTQAIGYGSHAEGNATQATGLQSHAEGIATFATGPYSHAEGESTQATQTGSHAEGLGTVASGLYQHVQGQYNQVSTAQSAFIVGNGTSGGSRSNLIFASGSTVQVTGSVISTQGFTGSLSGTAATASFAPAYLPVSGGTISGSLIITNNLTVIGSASIQYISESTLNIGTNLITVNTLNPGARFGGLAIIDSGSSPQVSASFLYDSVQDEFIFVHKGTSASAITSSHFVLGPETYNDLGNENYLTANRIPKGKGNEHLNDSNISDNGSVVSINSNSEITGSLTVTQGITGSLFGTSSWSISAISSSYPVAASSSMIYTTVPSAGSTGKNNTILLGANAGGGTTSIYNSNFIGISAGQSATNAYQSNFIGPYAGAEATRADNSNFIGLFAGYKAVSASFSTLIGWQAGQTNDPLLTIGSNNIIIGTNITLPPNTRDSINLGGIIFATGSYSNVGGFTYSGSQSGVGRVGINKVVPEYTLDVSGSGNYSNGLTVTGSLIATSSWATNAVTASYVLNAVSSSFTSTASFAPNYVLSSVTSSMLEPYVLSSNTSSFVTNSQTSSMSVATASYVQNAQSASYVLQAVSSSFATSASYAANGGVTQIIAGANITITPTNGLGAVTIASTGGGGSGAGANVTSSFTNQSTWTFIHALGNQGVVVQTYDTSWNQIIPQNITLTDSNTATITFPSPQSGYAIATLGGTVSTAATASYVLNAVSSSFASTASFVNTLNQNVIITGSLAIGTGSIGSGENNLVLGPAPGGGTGEGGQIGLLGTGGSYTSSSFIDTYQNQIRIIAGQGSVSTTGILAIDLGTKNAIFQGAVTASGFNGLPNDYLYAIRSGSNQTVGSAWANTDIVFNSVSVSKGISFNTSTGVASLTGGKVYRVTARLAWSAAAAYNLQFSCYTSTNTKIGPDVEIVQTSNGTSNISDGTLEFIYAPSSNTDIKIRCTGNNTALSGEQIRADLNTQFIIQQIA